MGSTQIYRIYQRMRTPCDPRRCHGGLPVASSGCQRGAAATGGGEGGAGAGGQNWQKDDL